MFLAASWRNTGDGNFMSLKSRMGGSSCWPSTIMWKRSRSSCACSSDCRRTFSSGFHPVSRLREYVMPCVVRPACQNLLNRLSGRTSESILCMLWHVRARAPSSKFEKPCRFQAPAVPNDELQSCMYATRKSSRVNVCCRRAHTSGRWGAYSIRGQKEVLAQQGGSTPVHSPWLI